MDKLRNKKIIIFIDSPSLGGTENQVLLLAEYLKNKCNCQLYFFNLSEPDKLLKEKIKGLDIPHRKVIYPLSGYIVLQKLKFILLRRMILSLKPDLIMTYMFYPNIFVGMSLNSSRIVPIIWNQRDEGLFYQTRWKKFFSIAIKRADCIISNSLSGANNLKELGAEVSKIKVIKNGYKELVEQITLTDELALLRKKFSFICVMTGNIHANKDYKTLVSAWIIFCKQFDYAHGKPLLLIAGKQYSYVSELKQMAEQNGINENILFMGFRKDIKAILKISDLYVHCSNSEGTSNAIIEAMYAEKPIVATNIFAIRDTVSPGNLNFLYEANDSGDLVEKILEMYSDKKLREKIGIENMKFARKEYNLERMLKETTDVINKCIR